MRLQNWINIHHYWLLHNDNCTKLLDPRLRSFWTTCCPGLSTLYAFQRTCRILAPSAPPPLTTFHSPLLRKLFMILDNLVRPTCYIFPYVEAQSSWGWPLCVSFSIKHLTSVSIPVSTRPSNHNIDTCTISCSPHFLFFKKFLKTNAKHTPQSHFWTTPIFHTAL